MWKSVLGTLYGKYGDRSREMSWDVREDVGESIG